MSSSFGRKAVIGAFVLALLSPGAAVLASDGVRASIAAVIANPGAWSQESNRLRANTPLWNNAVAAYSTTLYRLGQSPNDAVGVVGQDGWMFLGDIQNMNFSQAIGRRVLSSSEVDTWTQTLAAEQQWLAARGIPMVFVVGPAKWSVYPDKLPTWTQGTAAQHSFDEVLAADPGLGLVDLRPALREARGTADTYSKLNSHWTDYGAYIGWKGIASAVEQRLPGVSLDVPSASSISVTQNGPNEFDAMLGVRAPNPWTAPVLSPALPSYDIVQPDGALTTMDGSAETNLLDLPRTTKNPDAGNSRTALVLRDSMGDALSPYLQASFGTTVQIRHNIDSPMDAPNLEAWVDSVHPDVVIVEMAERHFNLPLPDHDAWLAANAYDQASASSELTWQSDHPERASIDVAGSLSPTSAVVATWAGPRAGGQVLRVSLNAAGGGWLTASAPDGTTQSLRVAPGPNVLFATLPAGTTTVSLQQAAGSPPAQLTSVSVRSSS